MHNLQSRYSNLPVCFAWLVCFLVLTGMPLCAAVQVHVQYLTTMDGLANN